MSKITIFGLILTLLGFSSSNPRSEYKIPRLAYVVTAGDLDLDGNMDLVIGHRFNPQNLWTGISIMHNNNDGTFFLSDSIYLDGSQEWVFVNNLNSDNFPDIIGDIYATNDTTYIATLLYNNGSYLQNHFLLGHRANVLSPGDINGDDKTDFVFVANIDFYWGVIYNDGQGAFTSPVHYNLNFPPTDITTGNLNQDGWDDVVIAGAVPKIAFSSSSGFQYQNLPVMFSEVHIADMDHNGTNDIIGMINFNFSRIYIFDGSQNFQSYTTTTLQHINDQFVVSDLNNDTLPDVVLAPYPLTGLYLLYNIGNNTFDTPQFLSIANEGENHRRICCADLDGNGYNDIAMVRAGGTNVDTLNNLLLFFNDGQGNFLPDPITYLHENNIETDSYLEAYPNPFQDEITFNIKITSLSSTSLLIYDYCGHKIKHLVNHNLQPGDYLISWDGLDDRNKVCFPGIYFVCMILNGEKIELKKIIIY
jgi:hypothetical protein